MHIHSPFIVALATLSSFAACLAPGDPSQPPSDDAPGVLTEPLSPSATSVCRALMQRERECSAVFIPALVAERVRLDSPAGIAGRDAQVGRDALVSEALDEYADDSSDERIAMTCADVEARLPVDRRERLVGSGQACLRLDACEPFVACAVPISIEP